MLKSKFKPRCYDFRPCSISLPYNDQSTSMARYWAETTRLKSEETLELCLIGKTKGN